VTERADIRVACVARHEDPLMFEVTVAQGPTTSNHRVSVSRTDFARLAGPRASSEEFVRRCFEFLLQREPKESIMSRFDVTDIGRYFPEFEEKITP
jgi:hypothetical protein